MLDMDYNIFIDGLGRTPVRLIRDGKYWWCEGVVFDYSAQGDNRAEAMFHFKIGFQATIRQNILRFGKMDWSKWRIMKVKIPDFVIRKVRSRNSVE